MRSLSLLCALAAVPAALAQVGVPAPVLARALNVYEQVNLVSSRTSDNAQIIDPLLLDAWGVAIRPPGAGGHWWLMNAASGTTTTYIGDAPGVPFGQDELEVVTIPPGEIYKHLRDYASQPTGVVYTGRTATDFTVSGEGITASAKFLFCALDGTISAWTNGQKSAVNMIDLSPSGAMFTGIGATELAEGNRFFVCDFGLETFRVYDGRFREVALAPGRFRDPRIPPTFSHYNCQVLSDGLLYVTFAYVGDDPGEEDVHPGYGFVTSFDLEGNIVKQYDHRMELNAPWGVAIAPADFGVFSGKLIVGNFGDGRVMAFDQATGKYLDYLRDAKGDPVEIDGLWGLQFGNGQSLGFANHLYFGAGPEEETQGLFGKLVPVTHRP